MCTARHIFEAAPGRVFDYETDLDGIPDAYGTMDERRAIKALIQIDTKGTGR